MPIFRPQRLHQRLPQLLPAFSLTLVMAGCVPALPDNTVAFLPSASQPSARSEATFAYLKLEQAMRNDDRSGVEDAAKILLATAPAPGPLADAAAWLLGNRYSEQAVSLLTEAIKVLPNELSLRIMQAEALLEEGKTDDALALIKSYSESHPSDGTARVEMALLYLKAEKYQQALSVFERLSASDRNPSVRYYHAQALRAAGHLNSAAAMLRTTLTEAPDFLEAMLELAQIEEQREHYGEARKLYEKLLTYDEGNQDIMLRLVIVALKEGNPQKAYRIASSVPDSLSFVLTASSLFMDEGRYDLANTLLDMMAKSPDIPEEIIFYQAAVAYEGQKNLVRTLKLLSTIQPSNRFYDKALKLRIQVLYEKGDTEQALSIASEAHSRYPSDQEVRYAEMELLLHLGRTPEALTLAEEAVRDWPEDGDVAFHHAVLVDATGDKAGAMRLMEGIMERFPDNAQTLNYVGYTLADENRDLDRALQMLTKAVELSPETDFMLDSLAWAQYRLGRHQEAWDSISHAMSLAPEKPKDATMWEHYGDIALAVGKKHEARRGWVRALEMRAPNSAAIRLKLEQL